MVNLVCQKDGGIGILAIVMIVVGIGAVFGVGFFIYKCIKKQVQVDE